MNQIHFSFSGVAELRLTFEIKEKSALMPSSYQTRVDNIESILQLKKAAFSFSGIILDFNVIFVPGFMC